MRFRNGLDLNEDHAVSFPEAKLWPQPMESCRLISCQMSFLTQTNLLKVQFFDETGEIKSLYRIADSSETEPSHGRPVISSLTNANLSPLRSPEQVGTSQPQEQQLTQISQNVARQPSGRLLDYYAMEVN